MPTWRSSPATERSAPSRAVVKKSTPVRCARALVLPAESEQPLELSYWDLWFALVAHADFEGSWERVVAHLRQQKNSAWNAALGIILLGVFLSAAAQAAVFTVNSPSDAVDVAPGNGICETALGNCTLRAAIQESNALAGADEIILPPNTYLLTIVSELSLTGSLTLTGGGASTTIIDGNKRVRPNSRVLVTGSGITVNISGVTIRNGGTGGEGGGIFNSGTLTLTNSTVSGNNADEDGGGIYNTNGAIATLTHLTVSGNNVGVDGGGIFNLGTLTLTNSTVSGNTAGDDAGGIFNGTGGTAMLTNNTVSGNNAGDGGGGIRNSGSLTLTNSTVSGNNAGGNGGGIYNFLGTAHAFNSTITENQSDAGFEGTGVGGGVHNDAAATFTFQNTILAGNFETQRVGNSFVATTGECDGTLISSGNNLMESYDTSHCTVTGNPVLADPKLGPLQNNSGPTQTHALRVGSPAIDGGNPNSCRDNLGALLLKDQRGFRRTVGLRCDIGAVEFGSGPGVTLNFDVDFDGDGKNDLGVYRDGTWLILRSFDGGVTATGFGGFSQDIRVPGDYDGDGKTDIAVYRDGTWFILHSSNGEVTTTAWGGLLQDIPVPGDYDGDGKTDRAVYRDGTWLILRSFDGGVTTTAWGGLPQDIPVPGDYDGDDRTDLAVYRDGTWFILLSSGGVITTSWGGLPQDIPVAADYDGDGRTDLAVYRDGTWFILRSSNGGVTTTGWGGLAQDVAVPGDYDGDGKTDIAVYRDGVWFVLQSSNGGVTSTSWGGLAQDIPLNRRNDWPVITVPAPSPQPNHPPVASAGPDQSVNAGTTVALTGASSSDLDGNPLTFRWSQTTGPALTLSNASSATSTFTAPAVSTDTLFTFQLIVNDGTTDSAPAQVTVTVKALPSRGDQTPAGDQTPSGGQTSGRGGGGGGCTINPDAGFDPIVIGMIGILLVYFVLQRIRKYPLY